MKRANWLKSIGLGYLAFAQVAYAQTLSLDSRYFQKEYQQYDIRGFPQFGLEITNLRHKLFGTFTQLFASGSKNAVRVLGFLGIEVIAGGIMDESFLLAHHEFSHASRFASQGWGYVLNTGEKEFFSYYIRNFGESGGHVQPTTRNFIPQNQTKYYDSGTSQFTPYADLIISAAGVNAEMSYASIIQDEVDQGLGHVSLFQGYLRGKLSTAGYYDDGTGDLQTVSDRLREMNLTDLKKKDLDSANYIAFFGSYTTWRFFSAIGNYFRSGEIEMSARPRAFRIPDLESFITSKGLSYRLTSGYRWTGALNTTLKVEHVVNGARVTESTWGVDYTFENFYRLKLEGHLILGLSPGWGFEAKGRILPAMTIYLGANFDQLNSLDGERHIVSLKEGSEAVSTYAGLQYHF